MDDPSSQGRTATPMHRSSSSYSSSRPHTAYSSLPSPPPPSAGTPGHNNGARGGGRTPTANSKRRQENTSSRDSNERANERKEFASALFNEDLRDLLTWHKFRPKNEQQRFLKTLDNLYGVARECKTQSSLVEDIVQDNGDVEKEETGKKHVLQQSTSTPNLRPIDMFLKKQKDQRMRRSVRKGDLEMWLDQQSVSTAATSTASVFTEWTDMTATTQSTSKSCPIGTTSKNNFRGHKRGFAVNRNKWKARDVHASVDNTANDGFPDMLRFQTTVSRSFGEVKKGSKPINEKMYESMFKDQNHPFIAEYLKHSSPRTRDEFCQMARCLENYRQTKTVHTSNQTLYDLAENGKLWMPSKARPADKDATGTSVPLGTIKELIDFHRENVGLPVKKPPRPQASYDILILDDTPCVDAKSEINEDRGSFLPAISQTQN